MEWRRWVEWLSWRLLGRRSELEWRLFGLWRSVLSWCCRSPRRGEEVHLPMPVCGLGRSSPRGRKERGGQKRGGDHTEPPTLTGLWAGWLLFLFALLPLRRSMNQNAIQRLKSKQLWTSTQPVLISTLELWLLTCVSTHCKGTGFNCRNLQQIWSWTGWIPVIGPKLFWDQPV